MTDGFIYAPTRASGQRLTSVDWNQSVMHNVNLLMRRPQSVASPDSSTTVITGEWTTIANLTPDGESLSGDTIFTDLTPDRMTIGTTGVYLIEVQTVIQVAVSGSRFVRVDLNDGEATIALACHPTSDGANHTYLHGGAIRVLNRGDVLRMQAYHDNPAPGTNLLSYGSAAGFDQVGLAVVMLGQTEVRGG